MTLIAGALLVGASAVYGLTTLSASVPRWIVLYVWAAMACVVFLSTLWRDGGKRVDLIDGLAFALLGWCALSLWWSADWRQGVVELTNGAALLCVFLWVRRFPDWIPEGALIAVILALALQYAYPDDWGGHGNRNFQTEMMILALCVAWQSKRTWAAVLCLFTLPAVSWFLAFSNPSKIEYFAVAALIAWQFYGRRNPIKLHLRPA